VFEKKITAISIEFLFFYFNKKKKIICDIFFQLNFYLGKKKIFKKKIVRTFLF